MRSVDLPGDFFNIHWAKHHSVIKVAPNHFYMTNATQGNSKQIQTCRVLKKPSKGIHKTVRDHSLHFEYIKPTHLTRLELEKSSLHPNSITTNYNQRLFWNSRSIRRNTKITCCYHSLRDFQSHWENLTVDQIALLTNKLISWPKRWVTPKQMWPILSWSDITQAIMTWEPNMTSYSLDGLGGNCFARYLSGYFNFMTQ